MVSFRYRAISSAGLAVKGTVDAASSAAVIQHLRVQGFYPVSLSASGAGGWMSAIAELRLEAKPSLRGLATITQELAALLGAGLELDRALGILIKLANIGALRQPLEGVRARVRDGANLSEALAGDPAFPKYYVSMVRAGEFGGALESTLRKLSDYLLRALAVRDSILSALIYPSLLLITAGLSIVVILVFVLPEFEPLFAQAGKQLPLATRIIMTVGDGVRLYWWLMVLAVAGFGLGMRHILRTPELRLRWDALSLRLPVLGSLLQTIQIERLNRALGTLIANGVPLPTALGLVKDTLSNRAIAAAIGQTADRLREGEALAGRLGQTGMFPPVMLDLVQIGEETGKLDEMLLRQADLDERDIRHKVDRLLAILVPALTVVLGMIVAGVIASMLVAILSINDLALQ